MGTEEEVLDAIANGVWGRKNTRLLPTVGATTSDFYVNASPLAARTEQRRSERLVWQPQDGQIQSDLSEAFWEFLDLGSADDDRLWMFAAKYGPLLAPQGDVQHQEQPDDWRSLSRGFNAAYDLALAEKGWEPDAHESRVNAFLTITVPILMRSQQYVLRSAEDHDEMVAWAIGVGSVVLERLTSQKFPERILNGALNAANVGPAIDLNDNHPGAQVLAVPVSPLATTLEVEGIVKHQVPGLLAILALSLATAMQHLERPRCSRCGKPARKLKRAPRPDQPWYGDHDTCRAQAHLESVTRTNARLAQLARDARTSRQE